MAAFLKGFSLIFVAYVELFQSLPGNIAKIPGLLKAFSRILRRCVGPKRRCDCGHLTPDVYVRPDPLIYDQYYLMAQGLAVTWDNPDIHLFDMRGNPVSGYGLIPDEDYRVQVTVLNGSYQAPAPGLPVYLSYLSFGIGITSTPIGVQTTNLGVKGSAECPANVWFTWRTPAKPGHYCLQALLVWADDANPFNNLGQKNTQVGTLQSPAEFSIAVHNEASIEKRFEIEADMYMLPVLPVCAAEPAPPPKNGRYAESNARWKETLRTQAYGMFPVTADWKVTITPAAFNLGPRETANVAVSIEPATGTFVGTQAFNIHGFASLGEKRVLAGGVTLYVHGN